MRSALLISVLLASAGCPRGGTPKPAGPDPTVDEIVQRLGKAKGELRSFRGTALMEYWLGNDRFKGDVLVMGELGSKVRVAALSPAGGSTVVEMACDGSKFVSVNNQDNCVLTGPCNKQSIATFFGIELEPDDFLHLALGTPPVLDGATGTVAWDSDKGVYRVALEAAGGKQTIGLDTRDNRWDVVDSALTGSDGTVWTVKNGAFDHAKDPAGGDHRVPTKSRFTTPNREKSDLTVEWRERTVNVAIEPQKFTMEVPPGLPTCGQSPRK